MFPTLYSKKIINYDPFSKMFHQRGDSKTSHSNFNNVVSNEKNNNIPEDLNSLLLESSKDKENLIYTERSFDKKLNININPQISHYKTDKDFSSLLNLNTNRQSFSITNPNTIHKNNYKISPIQSMIDRERQKSRINFLQKNRITLAKSHFFSVNNNIQPKKFYYNKKFINKHYPQENQEDTIISNFNIKKNKMYHDLLRKSTFTNFKNNFKQASSPHNANINLVVQEHKNQVTVNFSHNDNIIKSNNRSNRSQFPNLDMNQECCHNNDKDKLFQQSLEYLNIYKHNNKIKNSFYYSLKGKIKILQENKLNKKNFKFGNLNTSNNYNNGNNQANISIDSQQLTEPNNNLFMHANQASIHNNFLRNKNIYENFDKFNLKDKSKVINNNENSIIHNSSRTASNDDSCAVLSANDANLRSKNINDIMLNNVIEKEYQEAEKKTACIPLIISSNRTLNEEDYLRNFNIFNMNNLNISHIKLKKRFFSKPINNTDSLHLFPKYKPNKELLKKENARDGVYNIVELKSNIKKKRNKFIFTKNNIII